MTSPTFRTLDDVALRPGRAGQPADPAGDRREPVEVHVPRHRHVHRRARRCRRDRPGPALDSHRDALAAALAGERVRAILVTHCHGDHSPLAAWLHAETGAPTYAFGPHPPPDPKRNPTSRSPRTRRRGRSGRGTDPSRVEETIDLAFAPDVARRRRRRRGRHGPGWTITAVHTPGHTSNHMCWALAEERALFTGDHVMGWSTTVVSPPDGDMADYIDSLRKVAGRDDARAVADPRPAARRRRRVRRGARRAPARARARGPGARSTPGGRRSARSSQLLYADVRRELHKAAGMSVWSHLLSWLLRVKWKLRVRGPPALRGRYRPIR